MSKLKSFINKIRITLANREQFIELLRKNGVEIGRDCVIDKRTVFGTEPYLISIGDHVRITQGVKFITHDGGLWVPRHIGLVNKDADKFGRIVIGNNVNIGWNAIILPNVNVGNNCVIAAGAVVTKDIPDNCVVAGVPAKTIESIEEYSKKNQNSIVLTKSMSSSEKRRTLEELYNTDK